MKIKNVGVVGSGQMGAGIALVSAQAGYSTVIHDVEEGLVQAAMASIEEQLEKAVKKSRLVKQEIAGITARLRSTTDLADLKECDIVIEAAVENMRIKKAIFADLDKLCRPETILASNTSCLSVTEIAMATERTDKVIGLHFFNPAPLMMLLEIVTTILSSEQTVNTVKRFGQSLGKSAIVSRDLPGFIVNRLLGPYLLDAMRMLESGLATREDIDAAMVLGCNYPMGPLRLADLIGLDNLSYIADSMYDELKDPRFAPPLILKRMVTAGHLGKKAGKGFYEYPKGK